MRAYIRPIATGLLLACTLTACNWFGPPPPPPPTSSGPPPTTIHTSPSG